MSRHWRPEGKIVRGPWGSPHDYVPPRRGAPKVRGRTALLVLGAMFAGVIGWTAWLSRPARPVESAPSSPIEWNAVQAVPTRTPDPEDIEWQKRALEPLAEPVAAAPSATVAMPSEVAPGTTIYVIDGDTFSLGRQKIRIAGINAPEIHPPRCVQEAQLGLAATQKLKELLSSGTVTISGSGRDKYGRELRQVSVNGVDVAQSMIAAGLASSYEGKKRQGWC